MTNYTPVDHLKDDKKKKVSSISHGGAERGGEYVPDRQDDYVAVQEVAEHEPSKEVSEYVDDRKEKVDLSKEAVDAGAVSTAAPNYPVYNILKLPISDNRVYKGLQAPANTSIRWFAEFCNYLLKRAHLHLKKIHGRIMRVIQ
jgi:hypothetical protein